MAQFADERQAIREAIDAAIPLAIEHFGSTAIPGMPAKPIIDIMIGADRQHWSAIIQALQCLAYVHWTDNPDPDREFLVKGMPPCGARRTHHVLLCEKDSPFWERLLFRDYLQHHADERQAYADLKAQLAARYPKDREAYTQGKAALVAAITGRARAWRRVWLR